MKGIGKVYFNFEDIKKLGNLPEDAILKQYITNTLDDTVEIQFYSNEVNDDSGIRREKLIKGHLGVFNGERVLNINIDQLINEISDKVAKRLNSQNKCDAY